MSQRWLGGGREGSFRAEVLGLAVIFAAGAGGSCFGSCDINLSGTCGDGVATWGEECDGLDFGGHTCASRGYGGGELACTVWCQLDTSGCTPKPDPPLCGNRRLDPGEECDGWFIFGSGVFCHDVGLSGFGGSLSCDSECHWDVSHCSSERCDNRWDDDGDGLVDCDDTDCRGVGSCPSELCYDGVDNDRDGLTDCEDPDCASQFPDCNGGLYPTEDAYHGLCGNGLDDDGDGLEDREDPDCLGYRTVLFLRDLNGGAFAVGDDIHAELVVYADATDLAGVQSRLVLPEGIVVWSVPEDATYVPEQNDVEWSISMLPWGTAATLSVEGWIESDLAFGAELCLTATLEAATPFETWQSDDPDSVGEEAPSCIVVR